MIRRWTVRAHSPRSGLPMRLGGARGRHLTYRGALRACAALNSRVATRGPDDPIYKPEWRRHPDVAQEGGTMGEYGPDRLLRMRLWIRRWRAERFHRKVAERLRKAGAR
jgi:hypothetical protein